MWLEHNEQEAEWLEMRQGKVTASSYGTEPPRLSKELGIYSKYRGATECFQAGR